MNAVQTLKLSICVTALLLSGCSAKVSSNPEDVFRDLKPVPDNFANKVAGPNVDGKWQSECVKNPRGEDYMLVQLTISGQNVARETDSYSDLACQQAGEKKVETGWFRYESLNHFNEYEVEYKFKTTNGSYTQYEVFKMFDEKLWISGLIGGDAQASIEMSKDDGGTNPNPPAPTPAPVGNHTPTYGDYIVFDGNSNGAPQTETYTNQGFDSHEGTWTVFREIQGSRVDMGYSYYDSLSSSEEARSLLANCVAKGGVREVIKVKAGSFDTCKINTGTRTEWQGEAPLFNLVKVESNNGSYKGELREMHWGDSNR